MDKLSVSNAGKLKKENAKAQFQEKTDVDNYAKGKDEIKTAKAAEATQAARAKEIQKQTDAAAKAAAKVQAGKLLQVYEDYFERMPNAFRRPHRKFTLNSDPDEIDFEIKQIQRELGTDFQLDAVKLGYITLTSGLERSAGLLGMPGAIDGLHNVAMSAVNTKPFETTLQEIMIKYQIGYTSPEMRLCLLTMQLMNHQYRLNTDLAYAEAVTNQAAASVDPASVPKDL